ncbi:MAG: hypothetical protein ACFFB3_04340 [Candidatus Hodarchaeota archaeon]
MLASTNRQVHLQLLVSINLLLFIISVLPLSSVLSPSDHPYNSRDNRELITINLAEQTEKSAFLAPFQCPLQNSISRPSQILQNPSQNTPFHEVGFQRPFWVCDFTVPSYSEINATLLAIGEHCYIFMDNSCIAELGEPAAMEQSNFIRDEFDTIIFPRVTDLAGHPNGTLGDIDGDPRIIILLTRNRANYYSELNEFPLDYSNECEMIYIYYRSSSTAWHLATVAHEFHHLIWFNHEMDEPQFILEALAQYAEYYAGYLASWDNVNPRVASFLRQPGDSLLHWNFHNADGLSSHIDYGSAYLFAFYIAEHYGVEILRNLITEPTDGPHGIEAVLRAAGYDITFNDLYLNWITAVTIDELGFQNDLYGFKEIDARISCYELVEELPLLNEAIAIRYYGFYVHKLQSPPNSFAIQIRKSSNQTIGVSLAVLNDYGWQVHQCLHDEADTIINDHFRGSKIDVAYLITSYVVNHTPTTSRSARGLGVSTNIEISVTQRPITSERSSRALCIPLSALAGIGFSIILSIWIKQNRTRS